MAQTTRWGGDDENRFLRWMVKRSALKVFAWQMSSASSDELVVGGGNRQRPHDMILKPFFNACTIHEAILEKNMIT